jgi:spore germination protein KA
MYHQEMIPTELLTSVIDAKQKVPFSTAVEVIGMLVAFELLQEAGLRLPNPVGDTVSIIGALIVGQAAVDARIVSPIAVIIVAFSGISSYTLPSQDLASAIRIIRFATVLAAAGAGIFGVTAMLTILIWHLCSIDSYNISYMHPFVDCPPSDWLRPLMRKPLWTEVYRDQKIAGIDLRKQK